MLAKCTNPSCSASFLRVDKGRLFRLETEPILGSATPKKTEYFWLCAYCSAGMTLRLAQDGSIVVTGRREMLGDGSQVAFVSINRENRRLLRSVSFHCSGRSRAA
jgi:hypothetical protein